MISDFLQAIVRLASQAEFWASLAGLCAGAGLGFSIKAILILRRSRGLARLSGLGASLDRVPNSAPPGSVWRGLSMVLMALACGAVLTMAILFAKTEPAWVWLILCFLSTALVSTLLTWLWWPSLFLVLTLWFVSAALFQSNLASLSMKAVTAEAGDRPIASVSLALNQEGTGQGLTGEAQAQPTVQKWVWNLDYRQESKSLAWTADTELVLYQLRFNPQGALRLIYGPDWLGLYSQEDFAGLPESWQAQAKKLVLDQRRMDGHVWNIYATAATRFEKKK